MIIYDRQTSEKLLEIPADTLAGIDMRRFDLRYADLGNQDLSLCNFGGMDLEGVQFNNSVLFRAILTNCNLTEAIFTRANLSGAKLTGAKLSMTAFSYATLIEADLSEITVEGMVNFRWIVACGAKFRNIRNMSGANFFQANLANADFEGTDFLLVSESDRTDTILTGTTFEYLM